MGAGRDPDANATVAGPALQTAAANDASPFVRSLAAAALDPPVPLAAGTRLRQRQSARIDSARFFVLAPESIGRRSALAVTIGGPRHAYLAQRSRRSVLCWRRLRRLLGGGLPDQGAAPSSTSTTSTSSRSSTPSASATPRPATRIDQATGTALGNLDLTSFEGVQKRRDVLRTYGSYPQPLLLLKALPEEAVLIPYRGKHARPSEIRHAGGKPIAAELRRVLRAQALARQRRQPRRHRARPGAQAGQGGCNDGAAAGSAGASPVDTATPAYQTFVDDMQPMLKASCAYGTCHSSPQADFYLTCGDDRRADAFNFLQAAGFVVAPAPTADRAERDPAAAAVARRPAASATPAASSSSRATTTTWKKLRDWARQVQASAAARHCGQDRRRRRSSRTNVMPKLLQRGCALEGCHSPDGFNDFRLRSGAQGFFAPLRAAAATTRRALTSSWRSTPSTCKQSRAVKKNIVAARRAASPTAPGRSWRTSVADRHAPARSRSTPPPQHARLLHVQGVAPHRAQADHAGDGVGDGRRAARCRWRSCRARRTATRCSSSTPTAGGADLKLADATLDANGGVTSVGNVRSALGACAGLAGQAAPTCAAPSGATTARKLVFAARRRRGGRPRPVAARRAPAAPAAS